jgi:hypothetical protein
VVYTLALPSPAPPGSQLEAVASPDGALGTSTDRVRVLAGRPFNPADPRAVMVDQELAARLRWPAPPLGPTGRAGGRR